MRTYLLLTTLLIPLNLWSAVAPHLLGGSSLPLLQLLTALLLLPGLIDLLWDARRQRDLPLLLLLALTATLIPSTLWSALHGSSLESGWIQQLLAALALLALPAFYLGRPSEHTCLTRLQARFGGNPNPPRNRRQPPAQ